MVKYLALLFIFGACASKMKDQMKDYRDKFLSGDYEAAEALLNKSVLKKDKKSELLWELEKGSVALAQNDLDRSIGHFQIALDLIDKLFTTQLSNKAASIFINDASDVFYGASYERSYAHYYLSKAYYQRYLKTGNKLDLQAARAAILAWDTYFTELQRSAAASTLYQTDLMLKVFGAQVHELSQIRTDKQIALQLYKDALDLLEGQGGMFSVFNRTNTEYIKSFEEHKKRPPSKLYDKTPLYDDLKKFLGHKIANFNRPQGNVVILFEEGMIPEKVGKPFNFGIRSALGGSPAGGFAAEALTLFAMNTLDMYPTKAASAGSFIFAHNITRIAVTEAAIEFELPMIDMVPLVQRQELFITNERNEIVKHQPLPVVAENGDLAKVVLEEDVVARYAKTGTRVAMKHVGAIVAAFGVYQSLKGKSENASILAKSAALATYVGASRGLTALERADTRHWTTLPQTIRLTELSLSPGKYKLGVAYYSANEVPKAPTKTLGEIEIKGSEKVLHSFRYNSL